MLLVILVDERLSGGGLPAQSEEVSEYPLVSRESGLPNGSANRGVCRLLALDFVRSELM